MFGVDESQGMPDTFQMLRVLRMFSSKVLYWGSAYSLAEYATVVRERERAPGVGVLFVQSASGGGQVSNEHDVRFFLYYISYINEHFNVCMYIFVYFVRVYIVLSKSDRGPVPFFGFCKQRFRHSSRYIFICSSLMFVGFLRVRSTIS